MRAFLTYVLAALACTVAISSLRIVFGGLDVSEFATDGALLSRTLVMTGLMFLFCLLAGAAVSLIVQWIARRLSWSALTGSVFLQAVTSWALIAIAALIYDSMPMLFNSQSGATGIGRSLMSILGVLPYWLIGGGLLGLVWGWVVWLRQPNNTQETEAAA